MESVKKELFARKKLNNGAIIMNANPFTLGHRKLVEYAAQKVDILYVFVVEENKSYFSYDDRLRMVWLGCKDIRNLIVTSGGANIISNETFPEYFMKEELQDKSINAFKDIERFALCVAPYKNIKVRFVGEEPFDNVTKQYNEQMKLYLPQYGVSLVEIPRFDNGFERISASKLREALLESDWDTVYKLAPISTVNYLKKLKYKEPT